VASASFVLPFLRRRSSAAWNLLSATAENRRDFLVVLGATMLLACSFCKLRRTEGQDNSAARMLPEAGALPDIPDQGFMRIMARQST